MLATWGLSGVIRSQARVVTLGKGTNQAQGQPRLKKLNNEYTLDILLDRNGFL